MADEQLDRELADLASGAARISDLETDRLADLYAHLEQVLVWLHGPRRDRPPAYYAKGRRDAELVADLQFAVQEELDRRSVRATLRSCDTNFSPAARSAPRSSTRRRAS